MSLLLVAVGLVLLLAGGEGLVRGATLLAGRLGVSPLLIGLTVVAFGTSMPELVTSLRAALAGQPDIAVGNVVGSNIANALLILGVTALVSPVVIGRGTFLRDALLLTGATTLAVGLSLTGEVERLGGVFLTLGLVAFLWVTVAADGVDEDDIAVAPTRLPVWLLLPLGLASMVLGANWFVSGAAALARDFGVSEAVIGLTLVAVGTSLPELVTSVIAARRGQSALAFGNVVGSNIFNLLGILGVTALVAPLSIAPQIMRVDIWVMAGTTVLIVALCRTGWRVSRREGAVLLTIYASYILWLALQASSSNMST